MKPEKPFSQLQLQFIDPIQQEYEVIRPIVLNAQSVAERSRETDIARTTVSEKAKRFVTKGMLGLMDRRSRGVSRREIGYPEPVAQHILYLKQLYPPIRLREIVRIIGRRFGYETNHGKVKRFLERNPSLVQLPLKLEEFHEFEDAYEARWKVVRMFYEGWNKKSVADLLKLSRKHVGELIKGFEKDGFEGLEDKRTRPANHPDNQMALPFMEKVFKTQLHYPNAGRFRVHGILEHDMGEDTPSESTVGRAMQHNRIWLGAPHPLGPEEKGSPKEPAELPYQPIYLHQYWFIDIRYLVKEDGKWIYSICIIEGVSRTILAGMASRYQDEIAILQLLHAAFADYGVPWGIVSDNGSVFTADSFLQVLEDLEIEPCPIQKKQAWQNLIESQFNIQRRLADSKFIQAESFTEIQDQHAAFIQLFNTTRHWAHRDRTDDCLTPVSVLGGRFGRLVTPQKLQKVFRHLQLTRTVNRHGLISIQRFYIYAERGLVKQRVIVWIYEDRLNIEYKQTLLARYDAKINRKQKKLIDVKNPNLYDTAFASPQLEMFVLDDSQWHKVLQRPPYTPRKAKPIGQAKQLLLLSSELTLWFWFFFY
jgi:putative transposase